VALATWDIEDRALEGYRIDFDVYIWNSVYNAYGTSSRMGVVNETGASARYGCVNGVFWADDTDMNEGNFYQVYYHLGGVDLSDTSIAWVEDTWTVYSLKFDATYKLDIWRKSTETYLIQNDEEDHDENQIITHMGIGWYSGAGDPGTVTYDGVNDWIDARPDRTPGSVYSYIDNFRVGKYCDPEPTIIAWGAEEDPPIIEVPSKLFGAGFNASSPFVNLRWTSNLTDISFFEIQNSTDKITWEYLGQSTNNSYNDFQVVNGTERYYRVRACNLTGAAWDNSTWADTDFETVYYLIGGGAPGPAAGLFPGLAIGIALLIIGAIIALEKRR